MRFTLALLTAILLATAASAQTFKVFYTFDFTDGSSPNGSLLLDDNGNLYGTTVFGGASNRGVVFKLDSKARNTTLYSFTGGTDGGLPIGRLIRDSEGNLYGVTSLGGDSVCSCGTVFKLKPDGTLTVLHKFKGGADGAQNEGQPELGLVEIGDDLYGAASFGGVSGCDGSLGCGVIYKIAPGGKESVLYRFNAETGGGFPQDLIADTSGNLYGETGGSYLPGNGGTIFEMSTTGKPKTLYTFSEGAKGTSPRWGLIREHGIFYGVTQYGGSTSCPVASAGCGVVFSLNANTETVLHTFGVKSNDGQIPSGPLLDVAGSLYGTTVYGGTVNSACTFGCGVIYRASTSGKYSVVYRFTGAADGAIPSGGVTEDGSGNLYGAAQSGGSGNNGVIFEITP
ncbi:MAG TPA: choice-of-anchor tandem repeat GloVer-containing protein [Terriglobales bacterium]